MDMVEQARRIVAAVGTPVQPGVPNVVHPATFELIKMAEALLAEHDARVEAERDWAEVRTHLENAEARVVALEAALRDAVRYADAVLDVEPLWVQSARAVLAGGSDES